VILTMRKQIVVDTNVLIYATFEDTEHHNETYKILREYDIVIPYIVLYEFLGVLTKLTGNVGIIMTKLDELTEFTIMCENLDIIRSGIAMMRNDSAPITMMNDYIILSVAMLKGALATYDKKLRNLANKRGITVIS